VTAVPAEALIGIQLTEVKGLPTLEIKVRTVPPLSAGVVAKTVSKVMAGAFGGCAAKARQPGKGVYPLRLEALVAEGRIGQVSVWKKKQPNALESCLIAALRGARLAGWGAQRRQLRLEVRPAAGG